MANAKERERMKLVSEAFDKLSSVVPVSKMLSYENSEISGIAPQNENNIENKNPVTKVSTLRCAIEYINSLEKLIEDANTGVLDPALYALNNEEDFDEQDERSSIPSNNNNHNKKSKKKSTSNKKNNKKDKNGNNRKSASNLKTKRKNLKLRQYHASDFKKKLNGNSAATLNFSAKPMSKAQLNLAIAKGLQNCKPIYNPPPPTLKKPPTTSTCTTILNFPPNQQPLQLIQLRPINEEIETENSEFLANATGHQGTTTTQNLEVFLQQTPVSPTNSTMMASSPGSSSSSGSADCFTAILEEPNILDDIQAVLMDADNFDILV